MAFEPKAILELDKRRNDIPLTGRVDAAGR